ncbi:hypothetical protein HYC85_021674 [Camellia sinensis]|uniref:Triosephosphate isomerase, cytosolic n=1 Tax=Camellia sinensis TaxID=4442 RepID=A0A7J7GJ44_CAMSI|nr:hypothetical protein HYC85_021674 [Camellia sinensis]
MVEESFKYVILIGDISTINRTRRHQSPPSHPFRSLLSHSPEVVVSPSYVFLPLVKDLLRPDFHIAAQNCWVKKGGAFTGEVRDARQYGHSLGHSERRALLNESNEFVGDKVAYALSQGLKVIACIGETLEQRESGSTMDVVTAQTKAISAETLNEILYWGSKDK